MHQLWGLQPWNSVSSHWGSPILPTCNPERCRQEAPSSTRWPRGPAGSCQRGWGGSDRSSSPAGLGRTMRKKGEGDGVDEMAMPCSVGSDMGWGACPAPLWVFTGERRKGNAGEKKARSEG